MKKIIKISAFACAAALFLGLAGCAPEELDTNQYSEDAVALASFGPNPVMRGGQLRFFGSNLQNITEVIIPGVDPITEIEVIESGKVSEISVTVPVEGPEVGFVSIKAKDGKEFKTRKELTYTEPIVFEGFSVNDPAYPGDIITLKGDYMNLVQHVVFEGGESVAVQEGSTRHEAKVVIPATAVSGKIILSDGAEVENLLYSATELNVGSPSVTRGSLANTKPGDDITFKGEHLEMIKSIEFPKLNDETLSVEGFELGESGITVSVPQEAADGYVYAISYAGGRYEICENKSIMPSDIVATNAPKAGDKLVISGENLDVVTKVDLNGAAGAAFEFKDGKLSVTVPDTAKDGSASLFHPNGNSVTVDYTLVKPAITAVSPLELYAGDEPVIVEGTDLDLVTAAKIGTKDVEIADQSATSITLATAVTSVGGKVVLTLANGETVESTDVVVMNYHSKVILTSRPAAEHIGMPVVLKGQGLDLVESIFVGEAKVTKYILRTAEEIQFLMPWNKVGSYELKFQLYDGDVETQADPIEVQLELQVNEVFAGNVPLAWSAPGQIMIDGSKVGKVVAGSIVRMYFTQVDQVWGQIQVNDGSWQTLTTVVPTDVYGWFEDGMLDRIYDLVLDQDWADRINNNNGLVIQGSDEILTKIEIINEIPQEITVYQGPCTLTWDDTGRFGIAMKYFEMCSPGSKLIFYINQNGVWGQAQLNDGAWGNGDMKFAELGDDAYIKPDFVAADVTRVELTLTDALLSHILSCTGDYFGVNTDTGDGRCGMVVQGSDWTIEQITILP